MKNYKVMGLSANYPVISVFAADEKEARKKARAFIVKITQKEEGKTEVSANEPHKKVVKKKTSRSK